MTILINGSTCANDLVTSVSINDKGELIVETCEGKEENLGKVICDSPIFKIDEVGTVDVDGTMFIDKDKGFTYLYAPEDGNSVLYIKTSTKDESPSTWSIIPLLKGEQGLRGEKGEKGDIGPQGIQGEPGEKGEQGEVGPRGEQGIQGERGLIGPRGEKGDPGSTGLKGEKGDKGDKGDRGEKGERGIKGDTGERGLKGERGDKGDRGEKGDPGEKGDTGSTGLRGEQGERGEKGEKGDKGDKGIQGEKGEPGIQGEKGEKGDTGLRGEKGDTGERGLPGKDGKDGKSGSYIISNQIDNEYPNALLIVGTVPSGFVVTNIEVHIGEKYIHPVENMEVRFGGTMESDEGSVRIADQDMFDLEIPGIYVVNGVNHEPSDMDEIVSCVFDDSVNNSSTGKMSVFITISNLLPVQNIGDNI